MESESQSIEYFTKVKKVIIVKKYDAGTHLYDRKGYR